MEKNKYFFTKRIWSMIAGFFVIVAGIVGIFQWDDRYAKCADLKKMEHESVKTFKQFQNTQSVIIQDIKTTSKIQHLQLKHQWTQSQISSLRMRMIEKSESMPDTEKQLMMTEYNNLLEKEKDIKNELDDCLNE